MRQRTVAKGLIVLLALVMALSAAAPACASTIVEEAAPHCTIATAQDLSPGVVNGTVDLLGSVSTASNCGANGAFFSLPPVSAADSINIDLISNANAFLVEPALWDASANVTCSRCPWHSIS